jgi:hypothetical protein
VQRIDLARGTGFTAIADHSCLNAFARQAAGNAPRSACLRQSTQVLRCALFRLTRRVLGSGLVEQPSIVDVRCECAVFSTADSRLTWLSGPILFCQVLPNAVVCALRPGLCRWCSRLERLCRWCSRLERLCRHKPAAARCQRSSCRTWRSCDQHVLLYRPPVETPLLGPRVVLVLISPRSMSREYDTQFRASSQLSFQH